MPIPAGPTAHLILVQPNRAFGDVEAFLDGPAHADNPHQRGRGGGGWGKRHVGRQAARVAETAPNDQVWVWWTGGLSWRHRARYAAGL